VVKKAAERDVISWSCSVWRYFTCSKSSVSAALLVADWRLDGLVKDIQLKPTIIHH